jgi:Survival motor neuron (SMN) interacting protein 1 (SIP1)
MPKRKLSKIPKVNVTAGPLNESTGQRSAFPQVVSSSAQRDNEWEYEENNYYNESEEGQEFNGEAIDDQFDMSIEDYNDPEDEIDEMQGGVVDGEDASEIDEEGVGDEEEWEAEPQTVAISYLESVRTEAEALPSLTYVDHLSTSNDTQQVNGISEDKPKTYPAHRDPEWKAGFLKYYMALRETLATAPEPNLSQDELDVLLHINPNKRPTQSFEEDALWRLKTLDRPSVTLLSMLDHQRVIHLLTHLRKKMSTNMRENQCMWLFFLLAKLEDGGVLNGDKIDLLRRIGRKCLTVRGTIEEGQGKVVLSTIDFVMCIIQDFYLQSDLEEGF